MVSAKTGVHHLQGLEYVLGGKLSEGHAAHVLHNDGEQKKSGVAVGPVAAGNELQIFLANNKSERIVVGGDTVAAYSR